jgi:hypothetical protein
MKAESQQRYHDIVQREIANTRQVLSDYGFKVNDVHIRREPIENSWSVFHEPDLKPESDFDARVRYYVTYDVTMSQRLASDTLTMSDYINTLEDRLQESEKIAAYFKEEFLTYNMKRTALKSVFAQNPQLQEQWDELMTMLKMAGFDDDLLKD